MLKSTPEPKSRSRAARKPPLGRDAWLQAARDALIREGISAVEVGRLARKLKVTRGGFYWFFDSRKQLLDELLADWERTNSAAFKAVLRREPRDGRAEFQAVVDIWLHEAAYSAAWDSAIRDWARVSTKVAKAVRRVDDERIDMLTQVFRDLGYRDDEAFVRARVTYFHQVGYYALGLQESPDQRLRLTPLYVRVLTGQ